MQCRMVMGWEGSFFINYLESVLGRIPPKLVVSLDGCQCCSAYLFTAL